jgi:hypothetical protein
VGSSTCQTLLSLSLIWGHPDAPDQVEEFWAEFVIATLLIQYYPSLHMMVGAFIA